VQMRLRLVSESRKIEARLASVIVVRGGAPTAKVARIQSVQLGVAGDRADADAI